MGLEYKFIFNPLALDELVITEPRGFADITLSVTRDEQTHGIGFEASTSTLTFSGPAADYLLNYNELYGIKSRVIFQALSRCDGPYQQFEEILIGRLNFGKLKKQCGTTCNVQVPWERDSCELTLRSRYDQQVNVDSTLSVDNITTLPHYSEIGNELTLEAVKILASDEARSTSDNTEVISNQFDWHNTETIDIGDGHIAPHLDNTVISSLGTFSPSTFSQLYAGGANNRPPVNFDYTVDTTTIIGGIVCDFEEGKFTFRLKGRHTLVAPSVSSVTLQIKIFKLPPGSLPSSFDWVEIYNSNLPTVSTAGGGVPSQPFDVSATIPITVIQGDRYTFSLYYRTNRFGQINTYSLEIDKESFFRLETPSRCQNSSTQYYMVHETLSHIVEQITNGCLRVKSNYYGRLDSQPYQFDVLGCGGLRMFTSGLKIRRAANATFFTSLKKLIEGLNAIDNIGFDVQDNDVRIEAVDFFYKDTEIASLPGINTASSVVEESRHYNKITAGYSTWKVEKINGLDEFNSEREYKLSFETINNELKIQSSLVTGSYPIEVTRQQSFAATGAADTSYDNEVFLICLVTADYPYSSFNVEQGGMSSPENMFSPDTVYNWRLRPVANMMRWYKTIAAGYRNFMDVANKIFFSSGTGNILAKGITTDVFCRPENFITQENQDLFYNLQNDYAPIWINEITSFDYPLSLAEYNKIKQNPYGYVSFQCGVGQWSKGFIKELKYRPVKGMANFTLIRKY